MQAPIARRVWVFTTLVLCASLAWPSQASQGQGIACEESGYCSLGKLKPFSGDIYTGHGLKAALKTRSYKNELIIMATSSNQMLPVTQVLMNLRRMGMDHVLILSTDSKECMQVSQKLPSYGCAWDKFKLPMVGKDIGECVAAIPMWHTRWRTLARAVRLGYNVLCSDTDVVFFDDPYKYFKSPPFKDSVIINQPEALYEEEQYDWIDFPNGGIIYVQNASPTGPAAWLIAEVSHRILRNIDSNFEHLMRRGIPTGCNYMDQDALTDALTSVRTGKLLFYHTIFRCTSSEYMDAHKEEIDKELSIMDGYMENTLFNARADIPGWMQSVAGGAKAKLRGFEMKMPHNGGVWDEAIGGNLYGGPPWDLSKELFTQIENDCPGCPMWPDPENVSTFTDARKTPEEHYLFAPPFLMFGYFPRGRLGYWDSAFLDGGPPRQVIGHLHYIPGAQMSLISKLVAKMSIRQFDWTSAHEMLGNHVFRLAQEPSGLRPLSDERVPRLLALHPDIDLNKLKSMKEWQELVIGLSQIAHVSNRAVVFPDVPCNVSWLQDVEKRNNDPDQLIPFHLKDQWFPRSILAGGPSPTGPKICPGSNATRPRVKNEDIAKCTSFMVAFDDCLDEGKGMLEVEFEHLLQFYREHLPLEPGSHNTLFPPGVMSHIRQGTSPASQILVLDNEQVKHAMSSLRHQRIVYLGHPVQLRRFGDNWQDIQWTTSSVCTSDGNCCEAVKRQDLIDKMENEWGMEGTKGIKRRRGVVLEGGKVKDTRKTLDPLPEDYKPEKKERRALLQQDGSAQAQASRDGERRAQLESLSRKRMSDLFDLATSPEHVVRLQNLDFGDH